MCTTVKVGERQRRRATDGQNYAAELLILLMSSTIALNHLSAICLPLTTYLSIHLFHAVASVPVWWGRICHFCLSCYKSSLASSSIILTLPSLLYAPLFAPSACSSVSGPPSLSPLARSFPRTACSQHPLPDWPIGIKEPAAPASTWLGSISATMLSPPPLQS